MRAPTRPSPRQGWVGRRLRRDATLYLMALVPLAVVLVFRYGPVVGNVVAFRRFVPGGSLLGEEWVGLRYVEMFLADPSFWRAVTNTAVLGLLTLAVCLPVPVAVALLLDQLPWRRVARAIGGLLYVPHVLSVVVVAGLLQSVLSPHGLVNRLVTVAGGDPIAFLQRPEWFRVVYVGSELWQVLGWAVVLHLAGLAMVDPALREAARLDGAGRWRLMWHVSLPGLRPTIAVLAVVGFGGFLHVGFEKVLLLYNPLTYATADVVSTYVYRVGLVSQNISYATAIGLFQGGVGLVVLALAHLGARRLVGRGLW